MKLKSLAAVTALSLLTAGCHATGHKQAVGTIGGAAVGGIIGSQFGSGGGQVAATIGGALIGGLIGSHIGQQLDEADRIRSQQAMNQAHMVPIGQQIAWNNPNSGNYGTITPVRDGTSGSGQYCREYQQTIVVGGKSEQAYGTACQQPDGSWEIQ